MRLIDADVLKEKILKERDAIPRKVTERYCFGVEFPNHFGDAIRGGIRKALRSMEQTPTIDAVAVVRCKDCKRCVKHGDYFVCDHALPTKSMEQYFVIGSDIKAVVMPNDFCSYGERRNNGTINEKN